MHQVQPRPLRLLDGRLQLAHPLERHRVPEAAQQAGQHGTEAERVHEPVGLGLDEDVRTWFDWPAPAADVAPDLVQRALRASGAG